MPKISLAIEPTFQAPVLIPVPGAAPTPLRFTFKYRTKDEFKLYQDDVTKRYAEISDTDLVMGVAEGWDLDDPFTSENVGRLLQKYQGAAIAISETYIKELIPARLGN